MVTDDKRTKPSTWRWPVIGLALMLYVGAYFALSRMAYRAADANRTDGFYFCEQRSPADFRVHRACVILFAPCLWIDYYFGSGRWPGAEPLHNIAW